MLLRNFAKRVDTAHGTAAMSDRLCLREKPLQ